MFTSDIINTVHTIAQQYQLDPAALLAVAEIESAGRTSYLIKGHNEPAIRFEGHYFDRRLSGKALSRARNEGLAHPVAGKITNPSSQSARWLLLERAISINRNAALESTSWGIGQVMGAHWQWLGFTSVDEMIDLARQSIKGQIILMTRFILKAGLKSSLQKHNWSDFAKRYNGPSFAKNHYHLKLEAAWISWKIRLAHEMPHHDATISVDKRIAAI
jgi:hypothetical protein